MDRWLTKNIVCSGGIVLSDDILEQGEQMPGTARELINYEPVSQRGYRRVAGYQKHDEAEVPGDADAPILLSFPALDRAFSARENAGDFKIYESFQGGWTAINSTARPNSTIKVRATRYTLTSDKVAFVDGANPCLVYDGTTDTELTASGAPAAPTAVAFWRGRLALAEDSNLILTAPNTDDDFDSSNGALIINTGQPIVALTQFREVLYIFSELSIKKLIGNTSEDFRIEDVTQQIGCVDADTIQEIGGDVAYLANDGIRSLAATERIGDIEIGVQSRAVEELIEAMFDTVPASYCSCTIPGKSQYRLFFYQSGLPDENQKGFIGRYDTADKIAVRSPILISSNFQWAETLGFAAYSSGSGIVNGNAIALIGHPTNGFVYRMEVGGSRAGEEMEFEYRTPPYRFDDINLRKVAHRIRTLLQSRQATDISIRMILDEYENEDVQPVGNVINILGSGAVYDSTALYDDGTKYSVAGREYLDSRRLTGSGKTLTFVFSGSSTDLPHQINSFTIEYALKGRR